MRVILYPGYKNILLLLVTVLLIGTIVVFVRQKAVHVLAAPARPHVSKMTNEHHMAHSTYYFQLQDKLVWVALLSRGN